MPQTIHNLPTVLLRHDLPDGTHHYDWMIARDTQAKGPLITFRLSLPLTDLSLGGSLLAEQIEDHRPIWLEYEGTVSGGRGFVRRIHRGSVLTYLEKTDSRSLDLEWNDGIRQNLGLHRENLNNWRVFIVPEGVHVGNNVNVMSPSDS